MYGKIKDPLERARAYAFLLLKFRPRSEKELFSRLKKKQFDPEIIKQTVAFLKEKGFIDDVYFAQAWIESRIKRAQGIRKIKEELRLKGIDAKIIRDKIEELKPQYCEEDIVLRIIKEKFARFKGIDPQKAKRRIYAYLMRRGFSPEIIVDAINKLCNQTS